MTDDRTSAIRSAIGHQTISVPGCFLPAGRACRSGGNQIFLVAVFDVEFALEGVGPLLGVDRVGLKFQLEPLSGGVQPSLDRPQWGFEPLGHLDQRLPLDVKGHQGFAVESLEPAEPLPEPLSTLAGDQLVERVAALTGGPFEDDGLERSPARAAAGLRG